MSALAALCSEYHAPEPGEAEAAAQGEWVSALSPASSGAGGGWDDLRGSTEMYA